MQQTQDLIEALRTDLAELTALHAPSGAEQPVIARLRELFTPLVDEIKVDHMGNLTATRQGSGPHIVVAAHADEIGAVVSSIDADGFLRLEAIGGVQPRLLEGRPVWVNGKPGVIGAKPGHLISAAEQGRGISMADLFVDLGVDSAAEVQALSIRIGDPVIVLSELRSLAGTRVAGKGIDNRASCVLLLHLLQHLARRDLPCQFTALVAVQEEVGLRGAVTSFERLRPDLAIIVDTFPATGTPDTRHMAYSARIGKGALITPVSASGDHGYLIPRAILNSMIAAAERVSAPYQLAVSHGGVTDAAAAHLAAGGTPTMEIKLPRRYSHTPVEVLDLNDLAAALAIVEEIVTHPPEKQELEFFSGS